MKKFLAILLSVMLVLAFSTVAFAATITVTTPTDGTPAGADYSTETYNAYKIFDAVKTPGSTMTTSGTTQSLSQGSGITYTITDTSSSDEWFDVLFDIDSQTGAVTPKSGQTWVTAAPTNDAGVYLISAAGTAGANLDSESEAAAFAAWLLSHKGNITPDYANLSEGANTVVDGYYLITSSLGTNLGLATADIPMTIVEKNDYPTVEKTVDDDDIQFGQDATFTLTVTVPETADKAIFLEDTMSSGLTFKEIVSVVNNDAENNTVAYSTQLDVSDATSTALSASVVTTNNNTFVIKIADSVVQANQGKTITVTYKATMNKNAIVSENDETDMTDGNINTVKLYYSNFTAEDSLDVHTTGITLLKYDASDANAVTNNTVLPGAVFELHDSTGTAIQLVAEADATEDGVTYQTYHVADAAEVADNTVTKVTQITTDDNVIWVKGLDCDNTYTWYEVTAPTGYNPVEGEITLGESISNDDLFTRTNVGNRTGSLLPSTGGIGTTIFYIVGAILVLGAGILIIAKRRSAAAEQ